MTLEEAELWVGNWGSFSRSRRTRWYETRGMEQLDEASTLNKERERVTGGINFSMQLSLAAAFSSSPSFWIISILHFLCLWLMDTGYSTLLYTYQSLGRWSKGGGYTRKQDTVSVMETEQESKATRKKKSEREYVRRKIYDLAGGGEHGVTQNGVSLSTRSGFTRALGFEGKPDLCLNQVIYFYF